MDKEVEIKNLEKILKALANRRRLAILRYLKREKEATVGDIADKINLSFKSTSRHLSVLSAADILEKEQRSLKVFYKLADKQDPVVRAIIATL